MIVVDFQVNVLTRPQFLLLAADQNVWIPFLPIAMGAIFLSYFVFSGCVRCVSHKLQAYWLNYQGNFQVKPLQIIKNLCGGEENVFLKVLKKCEHGKNLGCDKKCWGNTRTDVVMQVF